jgi:hypothetical protein
MPGFQLRESSCGITPPMWQLRVFLRSDPVPPCQKLVPMEPNLTRIHLCIECQAGGRTLGKRSGKPVIVSEGGMYHDRRPLRNPSRVHEFKFHSLCPGEDMGHDQLKAKGARGRSKITQDRTLETVRERHLEVAGVPQITAAHAVQWNNATKIARSAWPRLAANRAAG